MKKLKTLLFLLVTLLAFNVSAQEPSQAEKIAELNDKVNGLLERAATSESDLAKLTKIKVSGYIQAQYQNSEYPALLGTSQNYFSIRRARVKFTYEAADGVKFVLQPDFSPQAITLKDAYVTVNDRWTKAFSIWAGKFNRPNYEVEYSSSQREMVERSAVIRALYPGERAIGAKLEFNPVNVPIHVQFAVFNGADALQIKKGDGTFLYDGKNTYVSTADENKDYDNAKDVMARVTGNIPLGSFGGLDLGLHGYFGSLRSMATATYSSDYSTVKAVKLGDNVAKNWIGGEFQLFADVLGGLSLKGEYIAGKNALIGYLPYTSTTTKTDPNTNVITTTSVSNLAAANFQKNFAGYYLYLIKNLGKKNQFAFRYDYYDPNTDITGKDVGVKAYAATPTIKAMKSDKSDLATSTFGFAFHHYFDDNIRITASYEIVQNEKTGVNATTGIGNYTEDYTQNDQQKVIKGLDYSKVIHQNVFTLRIQAKF